MDSVELYRPLDCGWVECGGIRLACTPEREQEVLRQVAWAKTFGLPLELLSPAGGAGAVPADGHRRRALRAPTSRPTATSIPRSSPTRSSTGAREGGCRVFTHTRVDGDRRHATGACGASRPSGATIEAEIVVNAGGMFAAELGRMAGVRVPVIPFAHEYLVTQPFRERDRAGRCTCRRCATPTC